MNKYFVKPKASNTFTSETMHKIVLNGIDFELPEHIWDAIDNAFGNYWNIEVGYGGWSDFDSAVSSISNWLHKKHIIFPLDKIATIVNIMFDWIKQVPGALLDDNEVVIPHSYTEEERQFIKELQKSLEDKLIPLTTPYPCFNDSCTNYVYISDKLKEFYPETYKRLTKLFDMMEIAWGEAKGTKDIWIRDYMPIQLDEEKYLVYKYDPDYLKGTSQKYVTDVNDVLAICKQIFDGKNSVVHWHTCHKLDGGNVVTIGNFRVLTEKVFIENGKVIDDNDFYQHLESLLHSHVIILPWHCDNPEEPNADVYGHADGLVKWTGGNHVLMSNHRDFDSNEADEIRSRLENAGFEVTEMLFDVPTPNRDLNWAYINYLQVGNKIIVPTFGIPEDKQALEYIRESNPLCVVKGFRMRDIVRNGGALHCITWNIRKN